MNFKPVPICVYATLGSFGLVTIAPSPSFCRQSEWCEPPAIEPAHIHLSEPGMAITSTGLTVAVSTAATGGTYYYYVPIVPR
jgi:hypothetical protein